MAPAPSKGGVPCQQPQQLFFLCPDGRSCAPRHGWIVGPDLYNGKGPETGSATEDARHRLKILAFHGRALDLLAGVDLDEAVTKMTRRICERSQLNHG